MMPSSGEDAWDAFGSDDDDDDVKGEDSDIQLGITIATFLSQAFLKADPHIRLFERVVW
jgi:hypothetical protein